MLAQTDINVLLQLCKVCSDAMGSIDSIMAKVDDEELAQDLNRQLGRFAGYNRKVQKLLENGGVKKYESRFADRIKIWSEIQKKTALNNSSRRIANLLIDYNSKGIAYVLKVIHDNPKSTCCEFAKELIEFEEQNVEQLKYYMRQNR